MFLLRSRHWFDICRVKMIMQNEDFLLLQIKRGNNVVKKKKILAFESHQVCHKNNSLWVVMTQKLPIVFMSKFLYVCVWLTFCIDDIKVCFSNVSILFNCGLHYTGIYCCDNYGGWVLKNNSSNKR